MIREFEIEMCLFTDGDEAEETRVEAIDGKEDRVESEG